MFFAFHTIKDGEPVLAYEYGYYNIGSVDDGLIIYYDTDREEYGLFTYLWSIDGPQYKKYLFNGSEFELKQQYIHEIDTGSPDSPEYDDYIHLKDGDIDELHWDVLRDVPIGKEYDMNTMINYGYTLNMGISADPYEVASANYKKICRS